VQLNPIVSQFKDDGTWATPTTPQAVYVLGPPAHIELQWVAGAGLVNGGRYRVLLESDRTKPPVDAKMRPLTPPSWARHFRLVADSSGNLVLADSLYP
jgi:hypothetical protein